MTGRPSIASRISSKSDRCTSSSSASAARSASGVSARIMRCTTGSRSPRNMCSVRHRPMPSAPNSRARAASGPLSALARTPSSITPDLVGPPEHQGELGWHVARDERHLAQVDATLRPVDRDDVPFGHDTAVTRGHAVVADIEALGTAHRRLAPTACDHRGMAHESAAGCQDAFGHGHPVHVLRRRLLSYEHDLLAAIGGVDGSDRHRSTRVRPPRRAMPPGRSRATGASVASSCGCSTWSRCSGVTRNTASSGLRRMSRRHA